MSWNSLKKWILLLAVFGLTEEAGWSAMRRAISPRMAIRITTKVRTPAILEAFSGTLKIATYNICHARYSDANQSPSRDKAPMIQRLRAVEELLGSEAPGIAALTEVNSDSVCAGRKNQAEFLADAGQFRFLVEQREIDAKILHFYRDRYGNASLDRYPIPSASRITFPGCKTWEAVFGGMPGAALCDIALSPEITVRLLATHLDSNAEAARVECAGIIEQKRQSSDRSFLVVRDLNSSPRGFPRSQQANSLNAPSFLLDSGGYTTLLQEMATAADFTIDVGKLIAVLDCLLLPRTCRIHAKKMGELTASNHMAVFMTASPPNGPSLKLKPNLFNG